MAHVWMYDPADPGMWAPQPLLGASPLAGAALMRTASREPDVWVVVGDSSVHVNGVPLGTGIRVLRDRDELRAEGCRTYFSTESLAEVVAFPGAERKIFCPRCKLEVQPGSPAVCCPRCHIWHHQSDELPCWVYDTHCTMCDQPSALDAGYRWTPEEL